MPPAKKGLISDEIKPLERIYRILGWLMGLEPEMGGMRGLSGVLDGIPPQGDAPHLPAAAPAAPLELPLTCH